MVELCCSVVPRYSFFLNGSSDAAGGQRDFTASTGFPHRLISTVACQAQSPQLFRLSDLSVVPKTKKKHEKRIWEAVRLGDGDKLLRVLVNSNSLVILSEGWCHFDRGSVKGLNYIEKRK